MGNLVIPSLSVYPREIRTDVYTKTCTSVYSFIHNSPNKKQAIVHQQEDE